MTARTNGAPQKQAPPPVPNGDMAPDELMKAMGGNGWWNPASNDMIRWPMAPSDEETVPRAIYRMYAWLLAFTITKDNRRPYANKQGQELHLENMAQDLGIELHNLRNRYWSVGVRLGIWRNGTKDEGTRRLYLCAKLAPATPEDDPEGSVQTPPADLPPYIWLQIKDRPKEQLEECLAEYRRNQRVEKDVCAELMAAGRLICGQQLHDTWARRWELEVIRLDRKAKDDAAEEEQARQSRLARLTPVVQDCVQTLSLSVQSTESALYTVQNGSVRCDSNGASLSGLEPLREGSDLRAGGGLKKPAAAPGPTPGQDGEKSVQLPAAEPVKATAEETQAAKTLLQEIGRLQKQHRKRFEGEPVSPENKGDRTTGLQIVRTVGLPELPDFVSYVEQRALQNALGRRVGMGMIFEWAGDFRRGAVEREKRRVAAAKHAENRRVLQAAADAFNAREASIEARLERDWAAMAPEEKARRHAVAEQELKASAAWGRLWKHDPKARQTAVDDRAHSTLRREIEAAEAEISKSAGA